MAIHLTTNQIKAINLVALVALIGCSVLLLIHTLDILSIPLSIQTRLISIVLISSAIVLFGVIFPLLNKVEQLITQLQLANTQDTLTGLNQRHTFTPLAKQTIALSLRYRWQLSIIRFDIDHFKSINSQYGNQVGDAVIKHVALTISANCRESDNVFRFDGEEFVLLLPQTNLEQALRLATKINQKVLSAPLSTDKLILEVSVSAGVSELQSEETDLEATLKRADQGLKLAKEQGRNRVMLAEG
ncbi:GGDEF domain-containing protein [Paraglaciecola aquimarina]|uniref:diguanylate cyclase n=1 Tax=Paraglaciecola algarum TaxID=3050085 RepID=A0ABS9DBB6_9ALTE|nr:GGDEF domain-containing protein [Paraglaciecola sp. G1-23]MCF2949089.1 GGDEF domain-containing protein [Paraglaciecola sp. G1-23]